MGFCHFIISGLTYIEAHYIMKVFIYYCWEWWLCSRIIYLVIVH